MDVANLGRLERVNLREVWQTEDGYFTPWLAEEENIALLSEILGLKLEVEAQEKEVGPFRADILCKELNNDTWVLIENQIERTDHRHLGQLLTYAAGLSAVTIVWIAASFRDEHRATLDWLNGITSDEFHFFALEVELWRIGESLAAPKFNVVSRPNSWTKRVADASRNLATGARSERQQLNLEFWDGLMELAVYRELASRIGLPFRECTGNFLNFKTYKSLNYSFLELVCGIEKESAYVQYSTWGRGNNSYYQALAERRFELEKDLGIANWSEPGEKGIAGRRYVSGSVSLENFEFRLSDQNTWPECQAWMVENIGIFDKTFAKISEQIPDYELDS